MSHCTGDCVQHIPSSNRLTFTTTGGNEEHTESATVLNTQNSNHPNIVAGTDGQLHKNIMCFGCSNYGHYQSHCPQASIWTTTPHDGILIYVISEAISRKSTKQLHVTSNQLTIDIFCNGALLQNIHQTAPHWTYTVIPVQEQPTWKGICQVMVQCGTTQVGLQTSYP